MRRLILPSTLYYLVTPPLIILIIIIFGGVCCLPFALLDTTQPLPYDFSHVPLIVDQQHAQALYVTKMGAHDVS